MTSPPRVLLGAVTSAHGIKGEVKVKTFTEDESGLSAYGPLMTADGRTLTVTALRVGKPGEAIVRFLGIDDRNAAESLRGQALYVARTALPDPAAEEYYLADLIGLKAEDAEGHTLGQIAAVHRVGGRDVVEIETDGGVEMVPFTRQSVPVVDIAGGRIVVVRQER